MRNQHKQGVRSGNLAGMAAPSRDVHLGRRRIRTRLQSALDRALGGSPAQAWFRRQASRKLVVLGYHAVTDPVSFGHQLDHLASKLRPVSLGDILQARGQDGQLADGSVLVTFDDGDRSLIEIAAPMLRERRIPAVAFVIADAIDSSDLFWWDEVIALAAARARSTGISSPSGSDLVRMLKRVPDEKRLAILKELRASMDRPTGAQLRGEELRLLEEMGIEVGNHTRTHPCLPHCATPKVESEIVGAHERLTALLGHPPRAFAYPNGDWDPRGEHVLRDLGYSAAFLFDHRLVDVGSTDPLRMSRVRTDSAASLDRFDILMSGLHPALHHALGRP